MKIDAICEKTTLNVPKIDFLNLYNILTLNAICANLIFTYRGIFTFEGDTHVIDVGKYGLVSFQTPLARKISQREIYK